jgi:hypothetical protein
MIPIFCRFFGVMAEERKPTMDVLEIVNSLIVKWQAQLPNCQLILGGSLVSGLFVRDETTTSYDVDLRFLVDEVPLDPTSPLLREVTDVTGLKYRKTINVEDWPSGQSKGMMVEGFVDVGLDLPLEIEGCIRNKKYVGWARFYPVVLSPQELLEFRQQKILLRADKEAYKRLKKNMLTTVKERCIERGLV